MLYENEVGKLYHRDVTRWPEAVDYNYRGGGHELRMFLNRPSIQEVSDIRHGEAEFGLLVEGTIIFLLYRFGKSIQWSDAPFTWWVVPESERAMPNPEPTLSERALVQIILTDAATGIIKAMRALTWSPEFTAAIHDAIRSQASNGFDKKAYDEHLATVYTMFTSEQLLARCGIRTVGGS